MNYARTQELYSQSQELVSNKRFLEALNIMVKISSALLFYNDPPFKKEDLLYSAEKCRKELMQQGIFKKDIEIGYGVILRNEGKIKESIEIFDPILLEGLHQEALLEKAYSLELLGENQQAILLLHKGLEAFPFEKMILNNLATLYEEEEEWHLALNYYNLALEVDDCGGISYYNKGRILYILDQYKEAMEHFEKAISLYDPNDFRVIDIYIFIADTHYKLKHYQRAEQKYKEVIKQYPKRPEGYYSLAEFNFNIGRKKEAVISINRAIGLSLPQKEYFYKKAYYFNDLNLPSEAFATLQKASDYFPEDVKLLDLQGEIAFSQGHYQTAIQIHKKRFKIEVNEDSLFLLAESYFNLENYPEALFWINRFIKIEALYTEAFLLRAKINSRTGYYHLALSDLFQALKLEEGELYLNESDLYYFENLTEIEEYKEFLKEVKR